jgi:hypothetical protein
MDLSKGEKARGLPMGVLMPATGAAAGPPYGFTGR